MKTIKIGCACLASLFALCAMLTANAYAGKTVTSGPIKYTDTGEKAELGNDIANIKCATHSAVGEVTSGSGGTVTATYEGCEAPANAVACGNAGVGTIVTKPLINAVGWIKKAAPEEVGNDFKPAAGPTAPLAEFTCGAPVGSVVVTGSVIGKATSTLNEMSLHLSTTFAGEGFPFKNNPAAFEGGSEDVLTATYTDFGKPPATVEKKEGSEQKQSDKTSNTGKECTEKNGVPKCKETDPAEISTKAAKCVEEEITNSKGKQEKVAKCTLVQRPQPLYGRCVKSKTGLYAEKECAEAAATSKDKIKGKYAFEEV